MKYNYLEIGDRIRTERRKKGLTQDQLLELLDNKQCPISRNTLSKLENGELSQKSISMHVLLNIAELLDTSIYYLLGENKHKNKTKETIWKKLHLRDEVVDRISNYNQAQIGMLNSLIYNGNKDESKDNLKLLLDTIYEYKMNSCSKYSSVTTSFATPSGVITNTYTQKKDKERYFKTSVVDTLDTLLKDDYDYIALLCGLNDTTYFINQNPEELKRLGKEPQTKTEDF